MSKPSNISAVIFDCDGVMFDSRRANINFYNRILAHFGLPPLTEDQFGFVHSHTAEESVRHIFRSAPHLEPRAQAYRLQMDYLPFVRDMVPEAGLTELLRWLKPRFGVGLATNRSNTIGMVLECHGLDGVFDIVVSSLDVKRPKPDPEPLVKILRFFNIRPEQALYVGDSEIDARTALSAGVPFAAFRNGKLPSTWKIDHLLDLEELLSP